MKFPLHMLLLLAVVGWLGLQVNSTAAAQGAHTLLGPNCL